MSEDLDGALPVGAPADEPLPHPLCAFLGSKKLAMLPEGHTVTAADLRTAGYHNYWCRHSFTTTGPDGRFVDYEHCTPERSCFQPTEAR